MSLDVYLKLPEEEVECICSHCGHSHTIMESKIVYDTNITHNLGRMAEEAGIYQHLWRPKELSIFVAKDLIKPLEEGLFKLKEAPSYYKKFNAENGWGMYEHFVPFVKSYLAACKKFPEAIIYVSR